MMKEGRTTISQNDNNAAESGVGPEAQQQKKQDGEKKEDGEKKGGGEKNEDEQKDGGEAKGEDSDSDSDAENH